MEYSITILGKNLCNSLFLSYNSLPGRAYKNRERYKKIAILSRGYGRKTNGLFWVEFDSEPNNVGDESLQIKQKFPNINVIVSENRRRGMGGR